MGWLRLHLGLLGTVGAFAAAMLSAQGAFAANAGPSPLGKWRFSETASCGIDDVRAGNLLSVTTSGLRYGHLLCVHDGTIVLTGNGTLSIAALCNNGGPEDLPVTFDWRNVADQRALITIQGFARPSFHCSGNIE